MGKGDREENKRGSEGEHVSRGYLDSPGPLAPAFAAFTEARWQWKVQHEHVHIVTDVATAIVEAIRIAPRNTRIALATPTYPGFFEMLQEVPHELTEIPLRIDGNPNEPSARLDLDAIEATFAAGTDIFLLCNPHNPHGTVHTAEELNELARLAATHDVFVISDEIFAPLTHSGHTFNPFAPIAAAAGTLAVTATSASKGWNLAGAKCGLLIAADDRANTILQQLPPKSATRTSILGLHANIAAYTEARTWLDELIKHIEHNDQHLVTLLQTHLPGVTYTRPQAGYLAWLDFNNTTLGNNNTSPATAILHRARVALNDGTAFGTGGDGFVRLNLACAPETITQAVQRIAAIL